VAWPTVYFICISRIFRRFWYLIFVAYMDAQDSGVANPDADEEKRLKNAVY